MVPTSFAKGDSGFAGLEWLRGRLAKRQPSAASVNENENEKQKRVVEEPEMVEVKASTKMR
jgi:hypothetical protein